VIEEIYERLAGYQARRLASDGLPQAAVLIALYTARDDLHVILTKRTDKVEHHKGEISFPGGARDSSDPDISFTALRESDEEIGLDPGHVRLVGRVDDLVTTSGFHVTAFVGEIDRAVSPYRWRPQVSEVAEVLEVPLRHLLDPGNLVEVPRQRNGRLLLMEAYRFGDHLIWGATARMLANFLDVAFAENSVSR
jgi:8-oxo-dGTP pyrophosphatase MutT (NUDIX family)